MKTTKRLAALSRLGLVAGAMYMTPVILQLDPASASGAISLASDPLTVKECSDCHPAYGPRFLRSYAWQKIMSNLSDHFGEDASIEEDARLKIEKYLIYNAGHPRKIGIRISEKKWFVREHGEKHISAKAMDKAGSLSNCTACHKVRVPKK